MFVYSCSIKICALGFDELLESIFCILLVVEAFSLQKVVEMLEEVVVNWQKVRWIWQMRQNFIAQFIQIFKIYTFNWRVIALQYCVGFSIHQHKSVIGTHMFNFWSANCAMCSQVLSCRRIGPCLLVVAGCRYCSFWCTSWICWAYFSDVLVSVGFRKL